MFDAGILDSINLLREYHVDWVMIGITAAIALLLVLINLKKKQFFVYIGIALIFSGLTLGGLQFTTDAAASVIDASTASMISTVGSGILKELQKMGVIFAAIGVVLIILYVVLNSLKKKAK